MDASGTAELAARRAALLFLLSGLLALAHRFRVPASDRVLVVVLGLARVSVAHPRGLPPADQLGRDPAVADPVRRAVLLAAGDAALYQANGPAGTAPRQPGPIGVTAR